MMCTSDNFKGLIKQAVDEWKNSKNIYLSGACPVLWFGNIDDIDQVSDFVMTVGINPSDKEFLDDKGKKLSKCRFDYPNLDTPTLIKAYNEYFSKNPYLAWFGDPEEKKGVEAALNYLDASYYNTSYKYKAVHFDWFPFPTSDKFSDIKDSDKKFVDKTIDGLGKEIIDTAIDVLKPKFILVVGLDSWTYFKKYASPRKFLTSYVTKKNYTLSLIYKDVRVYGSNLYYPRPNCPYKDWKSIFEEFKKNRDLFIAVR